MKRKCSEIACWTLAIMLGLFFITVLLVSGQNQRGWVNIPLHAVIETAGVFAAWMLAALLSALHSNNTFNYRITTAMGLSAMGVLDLFHAAIAPGSTFIWLHGFAMLFGGLLFMGVYLSRLRFGKNMQFVLPIISGTTAAITGLLLIRFTGFLPNAFKNDQFAPEILLVNVLGGSMFLIAARRFYGHYKDNRTPEALLFTLMSFMFGIAGLAFPYSSIWNATWWIWHLLRLAAYSLSLGYAAYVFLETFKHLRNSETMLKTVLGSLDSGIITVNAQGEILNCNPAVERMFGYSASSLTGSHAMQLVRQSQDCSLGLRADGSSFPVDIDISDITQDGNPLFILQIIDITERSKKEQQLHYQAEHDALTQLPNRLLLIDRLTQSIAQAHRHGKMFAVMFIDLDNFKPINDEYGHHAGDTILKQVASQLKQCIREGDTAARLGGDEFVLIILDISSVSDCEKVAAKILHDISGEFELEGKPRQISCSIGISLYPQHGHDAATLVIQADKAMYLAKMNGRNNYRLYNAPEKTINTPSIIEAA
ncbi:diguanylate cyclase domain-containing protein [Sulfuriferula thiophila]|uniref:diguanylate cyclase domain-containing protein n=1 Tax=Sulfuriferula thiophila TaxID=1781211 RepID=UPI000F60665E|nr:diguanylate cyclase [Sulfuriferula thiophila]